MIILLLVCPRLDIEGTLPRASVISIAGLHMVCTGSPAPGTCAIFIIFIVIHNLRILIIFNVAIYMCYIDFI